MARPLPRKLALTVFLLAPLVAAASDDPAVRTRIFAAIDLAIGILTLVVQCLATGRLMTRYGAGPAAAHRASG